MKQASLPAVLVGLDRHVPLTGYSGACIAIATHRGRTFVRKGAADPGLNGPLRAQRDRLVRLAEPLADLVGVPAVLGDGEIDGHYFFDMELVQGRDAATHLGATSFEGVRDFASRIEGLIDRLAESRVASAGGPGPLPLLAKLEQVDGRTGGRHRAALAAAADVVRGLPASMWPGERSLMHGDLTLENVLVDRSGRLWVIDSIDGPFEHYWQDLAKLCQDLEGHWHRRRGHPISTGVTAWLRDRLLTRAARHDSRYHVVHHLLLAVTFARILPYTTGPDDEAFVAERVAAFTRAATDAWRRLS